MKPIRLERAPWDAAPTPSFQIAPEEQLARDEERKRILREELAAAERSGDRVLADSLRRDIARTRNGEATANIDTAPNPFRQVSNDPNIPIRLERAPWEKPVPRRSKYALPLPEELPPSDEGPGFFRSAADLGVKFAAGVPKAAGGLVGLGSMVPGVNEVADPVSGWLNKAGDYLETNLLSDYQQRKERELGERLRKEEGFLDQAGAALGYVADNPYQLLPTVVGSIPSMFAGGYAGKGIKLGAGAMGLKVGTGTSAALGEGAVIAGGVASDIAQQNPDVSSRLPALAAGAGGALVSRLSGRMLGNSDIDTMIARSLMRGEAADILQDAGTWYGRVGRGLVGEGFLEEAPQSVMERMATNVGTGRPIMENTGGDAVIGGLSGSLVGTIAALRRPADSYTQAELQQMTAVRDDTTASPVDRMMAADFIRRVQAGIDGPEAARAEFDAFVQPLLQAEEETLQSTPTDLLNGQDNTDYRTTLASLRAFANDPDNPQVWRFPVSTGLEEGSRRGLFAQGPAAMNTAEATTTDTTLTDAQLMAAGATPRMPLDEQSGPRGVSSRLTEAQRLALAGPQGIPSAGLPVVSSSAPGAVSPGVTTPPGASSTATPAAPAATATTKKATKKAAAPAAEAAETAEATTPSLADSLEEDLELADRELDDARAKQIMDEVEKEELGAQVQGAKGIKVGGRPMLGSKRILAIRDALLSKGEKKTKGMPAKDQRLVKALRNFIDAIDAATNSGTNLRSALKRGSAKSTETNMTALEKRLKEASNALFAAGQNVDNNAKDVEAIVRVVKDAVQRKLAKPGKTSKKTLATLQSIDVALSSGWAAAKREVFMGEEIDTADVSGQQIRNANEQQEAGNTTSALEKAAKEGYKGPRSTGKDKYTGILGVLQYLTFNTTPFGKTLAVALQDALIESGNTPRVSFVDKGGSRYDPKTNTIYINRGEQSAEVVLHETLHAATQWFVYQNPNDPAVKMLERSLDRALQIEGLTGDALAVQNVLKQLVGKNRKLDAVLELVSYTATLNDFRRALQKLESTEDTSPFLTAAKGIWRGIKNVIGRMLGKPSLASDVLNASMDLLERSRTQKRLENKGKVLEAAVQSNKSTQQAAGVTAEDYRGFTKRVAPAALSTKILFDAIGWNKNVTPKFNEATEKVAAYIRKEMPTLERMLIYINSQFSAGKGTKAFFDEYKFEKNAGYQQMEVLANFVERRPGEQVRALMDYMDGNAAALGKLPLEDQAKMKQLADNVKQWFDAYITALPSSEQRFFRGRKFSETLLFANRAKEVATGTFGVRGLKNVLGLQHRNETTLDGFKDWLLKDSNGDLKMDGRFYMVYKKVGLKPGAGPEVAGFMSKEVFDQMGKDPVGYTVDNTREWWFTGKPKGGAFKFTTSMTAKQALDEKKADELANALRNTMAALGNNYASKNFAKGLAEFGYENGKPTEQSVVFDSLEDIQKATGQVVNETNVLAVSANEARSGEIRGLYRRSGTWVKLPESKGKGENNYGALAGKYVSGPVWTAMVDMSDRQPLVNWRAYNNAMRWFKKSKTVFNPGTHVTNVASNITLAMMHDIPMATIGRAAKILALYEAAPGKLNAQELQMMSSFMNSGAMLGDYSSAEVKQALYEAWRENMAVGNDMTLMKRLAAFTNYEKIKSQKLVQQAGKLAEEADRFAMQVYAAEDNVFRLAAFLTKAGDLQNAEGTKSATTEQLRKAGAFARYAFLDYDIDSKAVRVLRQSVMPFVSWAYAVTPVLSRIALHQPWKIANILAAYYLLDVALASMAGDDDDETRKALPEQMRERVFFGNFGPNMYIRIPFLGDSENPVYYKLGDYVPFMSMTKGLPNGIFGQNWIPGVVTPGGPFISAAIGFLGGVDPYTGKPIHQPTDTGLQKAWNAAKFGYDIISPPVVNSRNMTAAQEVMTGEQGITGITKSPGYLLARTLGGLKIQEYNVEESLAIQDLQIKKIEREFKSAMRRAEREALDDGTPDYEVLDKELDDLERRMQKRLDELQGLDEEEDE